MEYILLGLSIVTFCLGYLFGSKYRIVKPKYIVEDSQDILDDVKEAISPPRSRILSPHKMAQEKQFDKDLSTDL